MTRCGKERRRNGQRENLSNGKGLLPEPGKGESKRGIRRSGVALSPIAGYIAWVARDKARGIGSGEGGARVHKGSLGELLCPRILVVETQKDEVVWSFPCFVPPFRGMSS